LNILFGEITFFLLNIDPNLVKYLFIYFIFPLYQPVTNLAFGSIYSGDNNVSIHLLTISGLKMKWTIGNSWIGAALNFEIFCSIYRVFVFFYKINFL
jgi:hypothetical protein